MTDSRIDRAADSDVSREKTLDDLFEMIDDIGTCMLTTRRADGMLVSRPMQVQLRTEEGELWFVTDEDAAKLDELDVDAHVNAAFFDAGSREWISMSGLARASRDREQIHTLHRPDWRAWFPDEGGQRDGGPDDPRMVLIHVRPLSIAYLKYDTPKPIAMFRMAKAIATGTTPDLGEVRLVNERWLEQGRSKE